MAKDRKNREEWLKEWEAEKAEREKQLAEMMHRPSPPSPLWEGDGREGEEGGPFSL